MESQCIEEILEEIEDGGFEGNGSFTESTAYTTALDEHLVGQVLEVLYADKALTSLHTNIEKCRRQAKQLCAKLEFITKCLPGKAAKCTPLNKEAAWGKFHQTVVANLSDLTSTTGNTQLSSFLCLRTFQKLLETTPESKPYTQSSEPKVYTQKELDVITYIGGCVVFKVRKCARQPGRTDGAQYLDVLGHMVVANADESENAGLVECLDRGRLVKIKPQVAQMFIAMEDTFNDILEGKTCVTDEVFVRACGGHDDILCGFYETVYISEVDDDTKEQIIIKMLNLYFKVRIHQKCRVFMDQVRYKTHQTKRQKALRKKLKMA